MRHRDDRRPARAAASAKTLLAAAEDDMAGVGLSEVKARLARLR